MIINMGVNSESDRYGALYEPCRRESNDRGGEDIIHPSMVFSGEWQIAVLSNHHHHAKYKTTTVHRDWDSFDGWMDVWIDMALSHVEMNTCTV